MEHATFHGRNLCTECRQNIIMTVVVYNNYVQDDKILFNGDSFKSPTLTTPLHNHCTTFSEPARQYFSHDTSHLLIYRVSIVPVGLVIMTV